MIGLLLSIAINFYAIFIQQYNASDAFLAIMALLVSFYIFCFIAGTVARLIAFRGVELAKKITLMLSTIGRSWSACILTQSWRAFIATEMLFVGATSLLLGSGRFGTTFADFNLWMFIAGLLMLVAAVVAQRIAIRAYKGDCI